MDTLRTSKISRLIQKELGEMFRLDAHKIKGLMVSVTEVRVSPDLSLARVYLSIFPDKQADAHIEAVKKNAATLRFDLGKRLGSQLRRIPELIFYRDQSLDYAQHIDELLAKDKVSESEN